MTQRETSDGCCAERLRASLLQAQRDYFGARTDERTGWLLGEFFHTDRTGRGRSTTARSYQA